MNSVLISAIHKSSGKTILSIGLAATLNRSGKTIQTFKKGPDYIDPIWLSAASQKKCRNLDFHFMTPKQITSEYKKYSKFNDFSIVEGNKGLFDGLNTNGSDSNAALAKLLEIPVILIIDTRGMTRGIAPLLLGQKNFDKDINIVGVVLNQVSGPRHEKKLRTAIDTYTNIPVLGSIRQCTDLQIIERHLGLIPANEHTKASKTIRAIGDLIKKNVDLKKIEKLTKLEPFKEVNEGYLPTKPQNIEPKVTIAIARDRAFGFYYPRDLEIMQKSGAKLIFFDTIRDKKLPDADGLFIGGGFPETHARLISKNSPLRNEIHNALKKGLPAYAECGGLIYLSQSLSWKNKNYEMAGVIPGDCVMNNRPIGRGYVNLSETTVYPWPNKSVKRIKIPGHEFHYAKINNLPKKINFAFKVTRGVGVNGTDDGIIINNLLASFTHLLSTPQYNWAKRFVQFVRKCKYNSG